MNSKKSIVFPEQGLYIYNLNFYHFLKCTVGKPEVITNWLFSKQRTHELTIVFLWFVIVEVEKWTANWFTLGRKGPSWRRIITVVPPLHLYHVFCNRSCNCHFSIFPLTVIVVVVTLVANWITFGQTIRIGGECICSPTSAVPIDVLACKFRFSSSDHVMVPQRNVFFFSNIVLCTCIHVPMYA